MLDFMMNLTDMIAREFPNIYEAYLNFYENKLGWTAVTFYSISVALTGTGGTTAMHIVPYKI